jgi:predicted NUDIX family phosphoesterase
MVWCGSIGSKKPIGVSRAEAQEFRRFIFTPRWCGLIDLIFVMHCDAKTSLKREHKNQITSRGGAIMNEATLRDLRDKYLRAARQYAQNFTSIKVIQNSRGDVMNTVMRIARFLLDSLGRFTDEEVLCVPRRSVEGQIKISEKKMITPNWKTVVKLINRRGRYVARSLAESSDELLQVVPICIIRNGNRFLTNVRHEPSESLHEAFGNWAGGHVRKQDLAAEGTKWESVLVGLRRELHEELSLEDLPRPVPVGIVHSSENDRAARHIGIVFEVAFSGPANIAAFDNKTIRERPDRYVRTTWMEREALSQNLDSQRDWSRAISSFLVQAS